MLIDTHAHLDDERFREDLPAVLERAASAGVGQMVAIGTTARSSLATVQLATVHPPVFAAVGLQPNNLTENEPTAWDEIIALAERPKVVAIGETGLDRYWNYTPLSQQEEFFARHLELGRKKDLAVVIHCREAEADVLRMLRAAYDRHGPVKAVMHSFTGDWTTAEQCLAMGLYISFAGMVTFKNATALREVAAKVPLDRMLIETDSPYLAPVPVRGKRNEPAYVSHTAALLASIKQVDLPTFAAQTTTNARTLFGLPTSV
jgi:TatD DNase family protein